MSVDEKREELGVVALLDAAEAVVTSAHGIGGIDGPAFVVPEEAIRALAEAVIRQRAADLAALGQAEAAHPSFEFTELDRARARRALRDIERHTSARPIDGIEGPAFVVPEDRTRALADAADVAASVDAVAGYTQPEGSREDDR